MNEKFDTEIHGQIDIFTTIPCTIYLILHAAHPSCAVLSFARNNR